MSEETKVPGTQAGETEAAPQAETAEAPQPAAAPETSAQAEPAAEAPQPDGKKPEQGKQKKDWFGGKMPLAPAPEREWVVRTPGKAEHCTLCTHRTSKGEKPACVEACGIGALLFVDWDKLEGEAKELAPRAKAMNAAAGTNPKIRYVSSVLDIEKMKEKV